MERRPSGRTASPVTLYPRPTVVSTHAFMSLTVDADACSRPSLLPRQQTIAWRDHGFRSSLGSPGAETNRWSAAASPAELTQVLPLPEADVLLSLLNDIAAEPVSSPTVTSVGSAAPTTAPRQHDETESRAYER